MLVRAQIVFLPYTHLEMYLPPTVHMTCVHENSCKVCVDMLMSDDPTVHMTCVHENSFKVCVDMLVSGHPEVTLCG